MIRTGHDRPLDEVTARYRALTGHRGMHPEFYERVLDVLGSLEGLRALDVGCGDGELLERAATRWRTADLWGVEFTRPERPLDRLGVRVVTADLRSGLPFRSHSMDVVISTETLEHLVDPDGCLREVRRVLRPGGRILLTIPNATGYFPFHYLGWWIPTRTLRRKFLPYEHPANTQQPVDTLYEFHEILDLLRRNDLRVRRLVGYRYFRYLLGLRVVGRAYGVFCRWLEPFLERVGVQRFAYNLIFVLEDGSR